MGGRKPLQLTGQKFGRLTVISQNENRNGNTYWECKCDCGNTIIVQGVKLKMGHTKSCGCLTRDLTAQRNRDNADGIYRDWRLYSIYYGMRTRCYNVSDPGYPRYGARGITVCNEWMNDFLAFQKWAMENGYDENLTIDRIDNSKGYSPDNCRWTDIKTQSNNRRTNRYIEFHDETKTVAEWAEIVGIPRGIIYNRLNSGWNIEAALTTPIRKRVKSNVVNL